jgi:serine/threonine protein kinase
MSDVAKDLIQKLLEVEPAKRLSATDALSHPFISSYN